MRSRRVRPRVLLLQPELRDLRTTGSGLPGHRVRDEREHRRGRLRRRRSVWHARSMHDAAGQHLSPTHHLHVRRVLVRSPRLRERSGMSADSRMRHETELQRHSLLHASDLSVRHRPLRAQFPVFPNGASGRPVQPTIRLFDALWRRRRRSRVLLSAAGGRTNRLLLGWGLRRWPRVLPRMHRFRHEHLRGEMREWCMRLLLRRQTDVRLPDHLCDMQLVLPAVGRTHLSPRFDPDRRLRTAPEPPSPTC